MHLRHGQAREQPPPVQHGAVVLRRSVRRGRCARWARPRSSRRPSRSWRRRPSRCIWSTGRREDRRPPVKTLRKLGRVTPCSRQCWASRSEAGGRGDGRGRRCAAGSAATTGPRRSKPGRRRSASGSRLVTPEARLARKKIGNVARSIRPESGRGCGAAPVLGQQQPVRSDGGLRLAGAAAGEREQGGGVRVAGVNVRERREAVCRPRALVAPGPAAGLDEMPPDAPQGRARSAGAGGPWAARPARPACAGAAALDVGTPRGRVEEHRHQPGAEDRQQGYVQFDRHGLQDQHGVAGMAGRSRGTAPPPGGGAVELREVIDRSRPCRVAIKPGASGRSAAWAMRVWTTFMMLVVQAFQPARRERVRNGLPPSPVGARPCRGGGLPRPLAGRGQGKPCPDTILPH